MKESIFFFLILKEIMNKCQAKVKKTVPGKIWGITEKLENCPNDAKGEGEFCEAHGCFDCSSKPVETCLEYKGVKLCLGCQASRVFKEKKEEERKNKIVKEAQKAFAKDRERLRKETEEKERLRKETEEEERERERDKLKGLPD